MKNKQFIFGLLFNGLIAQSGSNQIVVEETMFMDAPYVGEITTTNIKYAADGLYREETQMEVGSFFIRMAMGGNQIYGSILDGNKELRTVYNLKEEEYAQENFEGIRNNDGTPTLKGMENSFGRGVAIRIKIAMIQKKMNPMTMVEKMNPMITMKIIAGSNALYQIILKKLVVLKQQKSQQR